MLAGFENRAGGICEAARRFRNSLDFTWPCRSGRERLLPSIFGRRDAGLRLEGAIERPERLEPGVHRNGDDGYLDLRGIGERRLGLGDAVLVEEDVEVAIAEPLVDQSPQPVFGNREPGRERADGDVIV